MTYSKEELRKLIDKDELPHILKETFQLCREAVSWNLDILKAKASLRNR